MHLHYPEITLDDLRSDKEFLLPMSPLGGKGSRKGRIGQLLNIYIFRLRISLEAIQLVNARWILQAKRRGGRTILASSRQLPTKEEAERDFLWAFVQAMPPRHRELYFNIKPVGT